jgi:hypothetical protein
MIANALNGLSGAIPLVTTGEVTARDNLLTSLVTSLTEGVDDGETGWFVPPLVGVLSMLYEGLSGLPSLFGMHFELAAMRERIDKMAVIRDGEGEIVGLVSDKIVDAIQDVAAASGLVLDAYGDIIAMQRETPLL